MCKVRKRNNRMYRVWIDDIRIIPKDYNIHLKTFDTAYNFIIKNYNNIEKISFDHDLGDKDLNKTGYRLACILELLAFEGKLIHKFKWKVHSANPVGRDKITMSLIRTIQFINDNKEIKNGCMVEKKN